MDAQSKKAIQWLKLIGAGLALIGVTNLEGAIKLVRGFFGAQVREAPALVAEIKARKTADSAILDTIASISSEQKLEKRQRIRFQSAQLDVDPRLRSAVERMAEESQTAAARRARTEKLLEGLAE
jgi:hypothetical protein